MSAGLMTVSSSSNLSDHIPPIPKAQQHNLGVNTAIWKSTSLNLSVRISPVSRLLKSVRQLSRGVNSHPDVVLSVSCLHRFRPQVVRKLEHTVGKPWTPAFHPPGSFLLPPGAELPVTLSTLSTWVSGSLCKNGIFFVEFTPLGQL